MFAKRIGNYDLVLQRPQKKVLLLARVGITASWFVDPQLLSASALCGLGDEILLGLRPAAALGKVAVGNLGYTGAGVTRQHRIARLSGTLRGRVSTRPESAL
jgi:hypothetical protein